MNRIDREKKVVALMIAEYCRSHHREDRALTDCSGSDSPVSDHIILCHECRELQDYALVRLTHCPKGYDKSSCRKCDIHCYAPSYRKQIRLVMRYMGPRMLLISPLVALRHLWDEL